MELCRETPGDEAGRGGMGGFAEARRKKYSEEKVKFALFSKVKTLPICTNSSDKLVFKNKKKNDALS